jgi:uncharacterized protein YggE
MKTFVCSAVIGIPLLTGPVCLAQAPASDSALFQATTLNLSAFGEARVKPDMATIMIGVTTEAATAAEASRQNATRMNEVTGALTKQGVEARNIQTTGLNLNPQYSYEKSDAPRVRGYQAQNQVTVRVMDLEKLGRIVDAVVASGSNQINGITFGLADPSVAENRARLEAVEALRRKAELYAKATGHRVGRLVNLSESGGYAPPPPRPMYMAMEAKAAGGSTPVSAGELEVRIDVNGMYELAR